MEALKSLDWHSHLLVLRCFEDRLNGVTGFDKQVKDWLQLVAQFIPKAGATRLEQLDWWRAVLMGASLRKWYLSCLFLLAQPYFDTLSPLIMGFSTRLSNSNVD